MSAAGLAIPDGLRRTLVMHLALAIVGGLVPALSWIAAEAAGPLDERGALKAVTCSACHGAAGNSRSEAMPIIAGLDQVYFKKQIEAYAAGKRPSPEMEPYAKQVLELGVDDVAIYFSSRPRQATPVPSPAEAIARGRSAAAPCTVCHGPQGQGDPAKLIPSLAGQAPGYLREQMLLFKQDRRNPGDPTLAALKALMKTIPDESFADLAAYYSSLR
ncbi:MAG TPA: c-type cytochrome [Candidatus Nitrosotalea sp.]|jgi:cytochrome c553|nr:c-type cytochrome [Candidatus Nitrosotalea sp.]